MTPTSMQNPNCILPTSIHSQVPPCESGSFTVTNVAIPPAFQFASVNVLERPLAAMSIVGRSTPQRLCTNWRQACDTTLKIIGDKAPIYRLDRGELIMDIRIRDVMDYITQAQMDDIRQVDRYLNNLELFQKWFEELISDIEEDSDFKFDFLLERLRDQLAKNGFPVIENVDVVYFGNEQREFYKNVVGKGIPFIDAPEQTESKHGRLSHLVQWAYVSDCLEKNNPGSAKKLFELVSVRRFLWNPLFDRSPGEASLKNPGCIFQIVGL